MLVLRCEGPDVLPGALPAVAPATPEESSDVVRAACREVVLEAERCGKSVEELAPLCHRKFGRGAFSVHFASLADAAAGRCLPVEAWLQSNLRRGAGYPLAADGPVPERVLEAARAFCCGCPDGNLGKRVIYRRIDRLLEQLPLGGGADSRDALESYDPYTEVCICGEALAGGHDDVFTVVARVPLEVFVERQQEQRRRWDAVREQVAQLKSWGNNELQDREVGTELAEKTYREALRVLLDAELEDDQLEVALRLNLSEALARLGRWEGSEAEAGLALALAPQSAKARFRRGRARLRMGRAEEAREDLAQAAAAVPQDRWIREELEAAKHFVAHPVQVQSASRPERFALSGPHRASGWLWALLGRLLPSAWRRRHSALVAFAAALALWPRLRGRLGTLDRGRSSLGGAAWQ
mmetsp:Transcript_144499/g.463037  ORF Transcript_144499/g.463037 Transcript_144499/m.463037 type:complete len:411 (-) Transcript_144499:9-1241(-)